MQLTTSPLSMRKKRIKKELQPGERSKVDTGYFVAMTGTVDDDMEFVGGIKTALFGGKGLFLDTLLWS